MGLFSTLPHRVLETSRFVWPDRLTLPLGRALEGFSVFSFFFPYCNLQYLFKNCLVDADFFGCSHRQYLPDSVGAQSCGRLCRP